MNQFSQSSFFVKKKFIFKEKGVEMFTKDLDGENSIFIHFKDIQPQAECRIHTERFSRLWQVGSGLLLLGFVRLTFASADADYTLLVAGILMLLGILVLMSFFIIQIKYYLVELENESQMFIIRNKPNETEFQAFIDEIFSRRKAFYRENYFYVNYKAARQDEISRMDWLKSEEIITTNEYEVIVEEIEKELYD